MIEPSHDPVADDSVMSRVEQSALAGLDMRLPLADPDDAGLALYDGPVLSEPAPRTLLSVWCRDAGP